MSSIKTQTIRQVERLLEPKIIYDCVAANQATPGPKESQQGKQQIAYEELRQK